MLLGRVVGQLADVFAIFDGPVGDVEVDAEPGEVDQPFAVGMVQHDELENLRG